LLPYGFTSSPNDLAFSGWQHAAPAHAETGAGRPAATPC